MSLSLLDLYRRRRIVIHHTHVLKDSICKLLMPNDIVFFDDCLYSQYVFLKDNIRFFSSNSIDVVLGFSSGLYASEDCKSQTYGVESHILHDACNKSIKCIDDADKLRDMLPEMSGFMKASQIEELLHFPSVHLALHGCCHLKLQDEKSIIKKLMFFKKDLDDGIKRLHSLRFDTNAYVYPYVHAFVMSDLTLRKSGFNAIVGSSILRISIESLIDGRQPHYES